MSHDLAEILARDLQDADDARHALRDRLDRANRALIQVLYVAEVIDANGIGWAADSIRNAVRTAVEEPARVTLDNSTATFTPTEPLRPQYPDEEATP